MYVSNLWHWPIVDRYINFHFYRKSVSTKICYYRGNLYFEHNLWIRPNSCNINSPIWLRLIVQPIWLDLIVSPNIKTINKLPKKQLITRKPNYVFPKIIIIYFYFYVCSIFNNTRCHIHTSPTIHVDVFVFL